MSKGYSGVKATKQLGILTCNVLTAVQTTNILLFYLVRIDKTITVSTFFKHIALPFCLQIDQQTSQKPFIHPGYPMNDIMLTKYMSFIDKVSIPF